MRFLCRSIFITIFFIVPYASYALLEELHKLNKNLLTLSSFLSKELTSSTYEQLQEIIGAAYSKKNPLLLDKYEQTIAIKTARYLLQELLQEGGKPENRPEYIPFMSLLAEEISKNYPNKQDVFTCVSLASGDLENEFLLVRMLRFLGYTTVHLVAIDPKYYHRADEIKHNFLSWSNERKITISLEETQIKNGVILQLFSDYFDYINKVAAGLLPRNKLFLMIQASNTLDLINGNLWPPFMP